MSANTPPDLYRPNVAAILRNASGRILTCERADWPGCWQFPQGGVKRAESPEEALKREVMEELGIPSSAYIVLSSKGPYHYLFSGGAKRKGWIGQAQTYFLAELTNEDIPLNLDGPPREFRDTRWIYPHEFTLNGIPSMKHDVYRQVFSDFFNIQIS
ncbi:MAG: NUDIX domain-containing protein [Terrimicrobiaceae bacterium]